MALILSGLLSLAVGILGAVAPVAGAAPPEPVTRVLFEQRVERLPDGPVCWNVFREVLPVGAKFPSEGFNSDPPSAAYVQEGQAQLDFSGGPSALLQAGNGAFIGNNNWYTLSNTGTRPARILVFSLSCKPTTQGQPGVTQLRDTDPLRGILPAEPYILRLQEHQYQPGSQTPIQVAAGPQMSYVLQGSVLYGTVPGLIKHHAGDLHTIPTRTPRQVTNAEATAARTLVLHLYPASDPVQTLATGVRLPNPLTSPSGAAPASPGTTPSGLPRTGESLPWLPPLAMLAGVLLIAAGLAARRTGAR
ncbi:MAG: hypothetical protein NTZ05_04935 [Chloroflexi bacterium]|nr:hypothetical protein [Chloroflexota bacterium]